MLRLIKLDTAGDVESYLPGLHVQHYIGIGTESDKLFLQPFNWVNIKVGWGSKCLFFNEDVHK